ncbi:MAG: cupin domain-containing protein [Candidatus Odinarchaeia archaeon]
MKITKIEESKPIPNPHKVEVKKIYDTENAQVMHITLKPGESLKRHVTPVDVFFYILEGKGVIEIGNEEKEVEADTLIESPAKIPHCIYNRSGENLRVLVVKVPRPKEASKIL